MEFAIFVYSSVDLQQQSAIFKGFNVIPKIAIVTICRAHGWLRDGLSSRSATEWKTRNSRLGVFGPDIGSIFDSFDEMPGSDKFVGCMPAPLRWTDAAGRTFDAETAREPRPLSS